MVKDHEKTTDFLKNIINYRDIFFFHRTILSKELFRLAPFLDEICLPGFVKRTQTTFYSFQFCSGNYFFLPISLPFCHL